MPKYSNNRAALVHKESGEEILPGSVVPNFRGDEEKFLFVSQLPGGGSEGKIIVEAKVGGEVYPSVLDAKIVILPRWRVMLGEELIGRAEQWDGETKASVLVAGNVSEYKSVLDTANPTGVTDFLHVAMGEKYDARGGYTIRNLEETGIGEVWAIPAPYEHGAGQEEVDTGIRVVDAWKHGQ